MSKALQCDRCEKFFNPLSFKGDFATIKGLFIQNVFQYANNEYGYADDEIHLCPECTKKFSLFMNRNSQEEPDETIEENGDEKETDFHSNSLPDFSWLEHFFDDFRGKLCNSGDTDGDSIDCNRETPKREGES